jgi:hypothetical protein
MAEKVTLTPEQAEEWKRFQDKQKARSEYNVKRRVKMELLVQKAQTAGITVSDEEISSELKRRGIA